MVHAATTESADTKRALLGKRRHAHHILLLGIVIVNAAYLRLLFQDTAASTLLPLVVALLGLVIATLGFKKFADYQRRQRLTFSLTELPAPESKVVMQDEPTTRWGSFSRN